jgi:hypothetical protein
VLQQQDFVIGEAGPVMRVGCGGAFATPAEPPRLRWSEELRVRLLVVGLEYGHIAPRVLVSHLERLPHGANTCSGFTNDVQQGFRGILGCCELGGTQQLGASLCRHLAARLGSDGAAEIDTLHVWALKVCSCVHTACVGWCAA